MSIEDLKQWMAEASKDMRGRVQPIPEIKPFPIVSYDAADLPEPFSMAKVVPRKAQYRTAASSRILIARESRLRPIRWNP